MSCLLCVDEINDGQFVIISSKGSDTINKAAKERNVEVFVTPGTQVHVVCRQRFINKKTIKSQTTCIQQNLKRATRESTGAFNSKTDCLFCGQLIISSDNFLSSVCQRSEYSCVKTDVFVETIFETINLRNDDWAKNVKSRIEYFQGDLHAADCLYHRSCSTNFRTGKDVPLQFFEGPITKKRRSGRPACKSAEEAFERVCTYFNDNDEEQLSVLELVDKMGEELKENNDVPYSSKYMKKRLIDKYGDNIKVLQNPGQKDIITTIEKTDSILREYTDRINQVSANTNEQKKCLLEAAAKIIRSDIKSIVDTKTEYVSPNDLNSSSAIDYLPQSLSSLLGMIFTGKNIDRKIAAIGQGIVQAARPRAVVAPLQIGLAVQLYHVYRSRFLIDTLNSLGLCVSYNEVIKFTHNAASLAISSPIGIPEDGTIPLFAGDNVDHNTVTIDGKGTFHGMGIVCAEIPKTGCSKIMVPRKQIADIKITENSHIPIHEYRISNKLLSHVKFEPPNILPAIDQKLDLLWELSCRFESPMPNWSGMMTAIHSNVSHPGKSQIYFLPLINLPASDNTCLYSTLKYISKIAFAYNVPPVITFDQPLFWKSSEIIQEADNDITIKDVVLMMGTFHMLMNVLGAIGYIMDGSGFRKLIECLYTDNVIMHILSGKAVHRAFRTHLLLDKCIVNEIVSGILKDEPEFQCQLRLLEDSYNSLKNGMNEPKFSEFQNEPTVIFLQSRLKSEMDKLSQQSRTSKLWISYLKLVQVARNLVRGDRASNWAHHLSAVSDCLPIFAASGHFNYLKSAYLYLMKMSALKDTHPIVYQMFSKGLFVARRTDKFWSGLSLDLTIEQVLMRSLKTRGGLTRGSTMSETQRAVWTMSAPYCSEYNLAMQELTETTFVTSDQHKEESNTRVNRDSADFTTVLEIVKSCTPFSHGPGLTNIVTGLESTDPVNADNWEEVGHTVVNNLVNQPVFKYSFKRKDKVTNMACANSLKVSDDSFIEPSLLFQRLLIVAQTGHIGLEDVLQHELCPYPPALFEAKNTMRKADKPPLAHAIIKRTGDDVSETDPMSIKFVLDGGSLLHRLKWTEGSSYNDIAQMYADFVFKHYGSGTVIVFDGYNGPSIKDNTHQRRSKKSTNTVNIISNTKFNGKREDFLSNTYNKNTLIKLMIDCINKTKCVAIQAKNDADVDIVNATIKSSESTPTTLIGEDTDLLILLLHYASLKSYPIYFQSDKQANKKVYNIKAIKSYLGVQTCTALLFLHAFTGCDSTSKIYGVGKQTAFGKLIRIKSPLLKFATVFCDHNSCQDDIYSAGIKAMLYLFGGEETGDLTKLRHHILSTKILLSKQFVTPEKLPPTESSVKYHSLRTYYQVMIWMGLNHLQPEEWGWRQENGMLCPIMSDKNPIPEKLIKVVHCNCTTHCSGLRCSCKRYGLACTSACGVCQITSCENQLKIEEDEAGNEDESDVI